MKFVFIVESNEKNQRLDMFLAKKTNLSRSLIKKYLNHIYVNNENEKASYIIQTDDKIDFSYKIENETIKAIDKNLDIVFEDEDIILINKEKGLIVHPSQKNEEDSLVARLLAYSDSLSDIQGENRLGIVHRLDKDTSGLIIVAKNNESHLNIQKQFEHKSVRRIYHCLSHGNFYDVERVLDYNLERDKINRLKYKVSTNGREARTILRLIENINKYSYLEAELITGRTHQIRVHLAHIGLAIVGDYLYNPNKAFGSYGQILHAKKIEFLHPRTKEKIKFETNLPEYFLNVLKAINI